MCNSYDRNNLNLYIYIYIYVIVIIFNCIVHIHRLYTSNNSDQIRKEKHYTDKQRKKNEEGWLLNGNTSFLDSFPFSMFWVQASTVWQSITWFTSAIFSLYLFIFLVRKVRFAGKDFVWCFERWKTPMLCL